MTKKRSKIAWDIIQFFIGIFIIFMVGAIVILGVVGCYSKVDKWKENDRKRVARIDAFEARFAEIGDTVELNGVKIVLLI